MFTASSSRQNVKQSEGIFSADEISLLNQIKAVLLTDLDKMRYSVNEWDDENSKYSPRITLIKLLLLSKLYRGDFGAIHDKNLYLLVTLYIKIICFLAYGNLEKENTIKFNAAKFEAVIENAAKSKAYQINIDNEAIRTNMGVCKLFLDILTIDSNAEIIQIQKILLDNDKLKAAKELKSQELDTLRVLLQVFRSQFNNAYQIRLNKKALVIKTKKRPDDEALPTKKPTFN